MDKKKLLMMGSALVALSVIPYDDAQAVTGNVQMRGLVITSNAIAVNPTQSLNFGTFTSLGAGGTVRIDATGGGTLFNGVTQTSSSTPSEAISKIKAKAGVPVTIIADPAITITNTTAQTMVVNQFNVLTNAAGPTETISMGATTLQTVPVGATLNVNPTQASGTYTGTFNLTVNY